ncbi:four helix bundle protein [uncultured Mesonia sp.]|uniref:four helix bundle protein n=1 Tax=uncultured Mesonia sp. TaxID=399731 RepID=UPI00374EB20F
MKTHKDLDVWKNSINFVTRLYQKTQHFFSTERYGLTSQLRKSAVSVPSNSSPVK